MTFADSLNMDLICLPSMYIPFSSDLNPFHADLARLFKSSSLRLSTFMDSLVSDIICSNLLLSSTLARIHPSMAFSDLGMPPQIRSLNFKVIVYVLKRLLLLLNLAARFSNLFSFRLEVSNKKGEGVSSPSPALRVNWFSQPLQRMLQPVSLPDTS